MFEFTTETKGLNTYRSVEFSKKTLVDTVGIGMLLNNKIKGMLTMNQMFLDDICTLQYNISSKIVLTQYLDGKVNKSRIISVFLSIINNIQTAENYMLDFELIQLNQDEIYVNVSTGETELLYFPVIEAKKKLGILPFFKTILFGTEFDQTENCEYVTSLINFMNRNEGFNLKDFKELLQQIEYVKSEVKYQQTVSSVSPKVNQQQPVVQIREQIQKPVVKTTMEIPSQPIERIKPAIAYVPQQVQSVVEKEKKSLFGFKKKETKIKVEKIKQKKIKPIKSNENIGIEIPGMKPTEQIPSAVITNHQNNPMNQTITTQNEFVEQNNIQQPTAMHYQQEIQPTVMNYQQEIQPSKVNFGETTILQADNAGETTILGMQTSEEAGLMQPYLVRATTSESININQDNFHLGKEQSYVNYCITDNSSISRSHADVLTENGKYFIVDNNSLNHTYINDKQIASQKKIPIQSGDKVKLANEVFEFIIK